MFWKKEMSHQLEFNTKSLSLSELFIKCILNILIHLVFYMDWADSYISLL